MRYNTESELVTETDNIGFVGLFQQFVSYLINEELKSLIKIFLGQYHQSCKEVALQE
jgi:hypothetical protein